MTLDQIIAAEHHATRAIQHGAALATDTPTLCAVGVAMAILNECRHFAVTMADAETLAASTTEIQSSIDANQMRQAATKRLVQYLTPR